MQHSDSDLQNNLVFDDDLDFLLSQEQEFHNTTQEELGFQYPEFTPDDFEHQTQEMYQLKIEQNGPEELPSQKATGKKSIICPCGKKCRKINAYHKHLQTCQICRSYPSQNIILKGGTTKSSLPLLLPIQKQKVDRRKTRFPPKQRKHALTQFDSYGNKIYITKRVYLCGACRITFKFNEQLTLHLKQQHEEVPDGTIYGLKKETLLRFFHMSSLIPTPQKSEIKYKCGCGKIYSCSSSLRCHLNNVHKGIRPEGTIGAVPRHFKSSYRLKE